MSRPEKPRGYALIEMVAVIGVVTVMLGLCAGMLHLLMKLDRAGRTASDQAADMARLARDFRDDVHAAPPDGPIGPSAEGLTLSLEGNRKVEYRIRPGDVLRTVREGEKVRHFEVYRRPSRSTARVVVEKEGDRPIVGLVFDRPADGPDGSLYRDYRIEAQLGRDRRYLPRPE